jgi:hypothetical protein
MFCVMSTNCWPCSAALRSYAASATCPGLGLQTCGDTGSTNVFMLFLPSSQARCQGAFLSSSKHYHGKIMC